MSKPRHLQRVTVIDLMRMVRGYDESPEKAADYIITQIQNNYVL
jgi:hypothetical protein